VYTARTRPCTCSWTWTAYRTVYTARRVRAARRIHSTYTTVYTGRHGPYAAVYTPIHGPLDGSLTRAYVYTAVTRPCTRHVHGRYTAVYTARTQPYTRAVYTARTRLCTCSCISTWRTRPVVYMPAHGCVHGSRRPQACVHDRVYGRQNRLHAPCAPPKTAVHTARTQSCTLALRFKFLGTKEMDCFDIGCYRDNIN